MNLLYIYNQQISLSIRDRSDTPDHSGSPWSRRNPWSGGKSSLRRTHFKAEPCWLILADLRPWERGIRARGPDYIYALESMAKYRPMRKSTRGLVKVQSLGMPNFQMALSDIDRTSILWTWRTSLPQPATCLDHGRMASTPSGLSPTASDGMDVDSPSKCRSKSRAKHWTSSD